MAYRLAGDEGICALARHNASWLASMIFVLSIVVIAHLDGGSRVAVYALSFWHYYLYGLAYVFGAVSLRTFKRDAISMKCVALIALGAVYFAAPPDLASLAVVTAGFALNGAAAAALGSDRTYYGHEIADLPRQRSAAFPYSVISHPMLVGNAAAFGGTMINADFRQQWWPLACAHVAMNLGLLVMEIAVKPQRRGSCRAPVIEGGRAARACSWRTGCSIVAAGAALGAVACRDARTAEVLLAAGIGACILGYGYVLYCCYAWPIYFPDERQKNPNGEAS